MILSKKWIYLKGGLFLIILIMSAGLILIALPSWRIGGLLLLTIWASARLYYFMFYVIEHYVDESFRFSSIYDFIKYCFKLKK